MFKMREYQEKALAWISKAIGEPRSSGEPQLVRLVEGKRHQPLQPITFDPTIDLSKSVILMPRRAGKTEATRQLVQALARRAHQRWLNRYRYASHRRKVEMLRAKRSKEK